MDAKHYGEAPAVSDSDTPHTKVQFGALLSVQPPHKFRTPLYCLGAAGKEVWAGNPLETPPKPLLGIRVLDNTSPLLIVLPGCSLAQENKKPHVLTDDIVYIRSCVCLI
ncbi:hypothetical protein FKM82_022755 [Ascaphus truei]